MKRILFILCFIFVFFESNSQIITVDTIHVDCNSSVGYIVIATDAPTPLYSWYKFNDSLSIWEEDTVGAVLDSISFSECGNYRVIVSDALYFSFDTAICVVPCPMETQVRAHENIQCFGESTGYLKHVVSGGIPFNPDGIPNSGDEYYDYSWYKDGTLYSSGPNDTLLMNLSFGQYLVSVTDLSGCVFQPIDSLTGLSDTSVIFQPSLLRIDSLLINSVLCKSTNTGSFEVWVKGGKRFNPNGSQNYSGDEYYDYYLLNDLGDTVAYSVFPDSSSNFSTVLSLFPLAPEHVKFSGLSVGNYIIHVVDLFGCTFDSTIYVMEPDSLSLHVSIDSNSSFICEHDPTSIIIDSVSGGHSNNLYYYWEGTSPITDSMYVPSGTYHAIILDTIYGCKDSLDFSFTAPNIISCNVTSTIVECFGGSTGSLQIDSIYGGTLPYTVQWGGIDTNNLFAGQYTLFITDALGCTFIEDYEVLENPDVNLNETIYPPSCFGFSDGSIAINLTGGTSPFNYLWLNGTGGPDSLFSLSVDIYVLQTTDDLGCIFSDTVVLSEPENLVVNFEGFTNPLSCAGGQTLINTITTGGSPPYSYNWSTSDTMSQLVVFAGNYNILVTDDNGCISTNQILIIEPALLEIVNTSFVQATCNVGAIASVVVSGGTLPYNYIWSNGDTTYSALGLSNGTQKVIVTDSCGDTATYYFEVEEYILETIINYDSLDNFAVVNVISFTPGGPPYSYQWYDENMNLIPGETDTIIEDLCPSWYYCITTDANNCEVIDSVLSELYLPNGIINESTTTVYEDALLWGSEPYTYLWDNGNITAKGNICPGFHRVWVTDVNGCEVIGELNVEDILLTLSPSDIIIECDITNLDILLEVTATGGTGDYTYLWSNGQTENPINLSLNPGVYSVEVTDENFCNEDTVFHIAAMSSDCIPNVFSPNNDGSNDVWNLEDAFFYLDSEVRVFNRYGKLVFKSVGYNTPWDGKNQSGNNVEDGAYFYVINLGNDIEKIKGTVTIIR